jgi:hypothetical protein
MRRDLRSPMKCAGTRVLHRGQPRACESSGTILGCSGFRCDGKNRSALMKATPLLVAAFIAAGCSLALAQAGGGAGGGGGAGAGGGAAGGGAAGGAAGGGAAGGAAAGGAGTGAGADAGASAGGTAGTSAGGATAATDGAGSDQRGRRSFGVFRRSDDMGPLVIPREEAPVRLRTNRYRE